MKKVFTLLSCFVFYLAVSQKSLAQVSPEDSLALVDIYNATTGASWTSNTNWLTGTVDTWYGITVSGGRVTAIHLAGNNLVGSIPNTLDSLGALEKLDLSNNYLDAFPVLANTGALDTLDISDNRFTFEDILPNMGVANSYYQYAPQDSLGNSLDTTIYKGASITLVLGQDTASGLGNFFQWKKNNTNVANAIQPQLNVNCALLTDSGKYTVAVTNPAVPGLTLYRKKIRLTVTNVIANAGLDANICETTYQLAGNVPVIGSGTWSVVSGNVTIATATNPFTQLTDIQAGSNILRWTISNGICTNVAFDDVVIVRNSQPSVPSAGPDKTICVTEEVLAATQPAVGTGSWSVISGQGVLADALNPGSAVSNLSVGENIFRWQISNGVCQSVFDEVKLIRQLPHESTDAGVDNALCPRQDSLHATAPINGSGWWQVVSGSGNFSDAYAPHIFVTELSEGENTFRWTTDNTCNLPVSDDVTITVHYSIQANAGADSSYFLSPFIEANLGGNPTAAGGSSVFEYQWTDISSAGVLSGEQTANPLYNPTDTGTYLFAVYIEDSNGCFASDTVALHIIKLETLAIPSLFTPNGDGNNDYFEIPGVESYPENALTVIDRFGQVVYTAAPYVNTWDGIPNQGLANADKVVPSDTYYYILKLNEAKDPLTGFIVIKK